MLHTSFSFYFLLISLSTVYSHEEHWGYKNREDELDPDHWYLKYKTCIGNRQSPIDIERSYVEYSTKLDKLLFINYDRPIPVVNMTNDGHTIRVDIPDDAGVYLTSSTWKKNFQLKQFHFHWSRRNSSGSEHTIFGKHYPLEMHLVHADETVSFDDAQKEPFGLAVLAVLFKFGAETQQLFELTTKMRLISDPEIRSTVLLYNLTLMNLLPKNTMNYLQYFGSLTTPPCNEAVSWTILTHTGRVSHSQIEVFRSMRHEIVTNSGVTTEEPMETNDRSLQSIKNRKVHLHYTFDEFGPHH